MPNRTLAFPADLLAALRDLDPVRLRPRATLCVHLHEDTLDGGPGVARVEGLGPFALAQLRDLLGHAHLDLKPVIDLAERVSVNGYEHPERVKERVQLRWVGDALPHASGTTRDVDYDHPVPYDPNGPPGQTGTHRIDQSEADALTGDDPVDRAIARLWHRHRTGQLDRHHPVTKAIGTSATPKSVRWTAGNSEAWVPPRQGAA